MRHDRGFTITEIAVCIAIVLILAMISIVVVPKVIIASKGNACVGNLRSIYVGAKLYASDHDDRLPPYGFETFGPIREGRQQFITALTGYGVVTNSFRCPLDTRFGTQAMGEFHVFDVTSYWLSWDVYSAAKKFSKRANELSFAAFENPSTSMFLLDQTFLEETEHGVQRKSAHDGFTNVLYADGRIKSEPVPKP